MPQIAVLYLAQVITKYVGLPCGVQY